MGDFCGNSAGGGADEEPLGGACDAAPSAAAAGDAQGVVALAGESGGLGAFVGQVGLRGGEFGLAGFALDREVVERLQVFGGDDGVGFWRGGVWQSRGGLQSDR